MVENGEGFNGGKGGGVYWWERGRGLMMEKGERFNGGKGGFNGGKEGGV